MSFAKTLSFLDIVLLMAPTIAFTLLAVFRVDERVAAGQARGRHRRKFCEVDLDGRGLLFDPDGQHGDRSRFPQTRSKRQLKLP